MFILYTLLLICFLSLLLLFYKVTKSNHAIDVNVRKNTQKIKLDDDYEIDFDKKLILDKEKKKHQRKKEISNWLKNKSDYINSI
jgi:hypothetical protein